MIQSLGPKRLGLLHDLLPDAEVIGILFNPTNPAAETQSEELRTAARSLGLSLHVGIRNAGQELETAFAHLNEQRVGALIIVPDDMLQDSRAQIVALAASHTIPAIYAEAGGLISYGSDIFKAARQQGAYVGQILNGAKPADLPDCTNLRAMSVSASALVIAALSFMMIGRGVRAGRYGYP